jgi:hypothetical protein
VVRTPASHVGNAGSTPAGITKKIRYIHDRTFRTGPLVPNRCQIFSGFSGSNPRVLSRLPLPYSRVKTILIVRLLAVILVTLLLPFSIGTPSAMACSTPSCCGPICPRSTPLNQSSCCKAPAAPDRATNQTRDAQHFDSIGSMLVAAAIVPISHLRNTGIARGYSPPDRLASLALLCSRQI